MIKLKISGIFSCLCFAGICTAFLINRDPFIELGSKLLWRIDKNSYCGNGIYFRDDDYVISPSPYASGDYEFEQLSRLSETLEAEGISLLYVNKPAKYLDDSIFRQYGTENFCNDNADRLLARLNEAGINTLDLRDELKRDGLDVYDMFYRTDHHWTVPAGKWGAEKIAAALNEKCGYSIDTSVYADENYTFKTTKEAWLGEQGAKFRGAGIRKDDYTLVTPDFDTDYTVDGEDLTFTEAFISDPEECYHYNYSPRNCINNSVSKGKILMLGDSYDAVTEPFLSLSVREMDFMVMRDTAPDSLTLDMIKEGGYDTVIVCYAPFMIGAHEDTSNANYRMFSFESITSGSTGTAQQ